MRKLEKAREIKGKRILFARCTKIKKFKAGIMKLDTPGFE